jgi:hypothetical protein
MVLAGSDDDRELLNSRRIKADPRASQWCFICPMDMKPPRVFAPNNIWQLQSAPAFCGRLFFEVSRIEGPAEQGCVRRAWLLVAVGATSVT